MLRVETFPQPPFIHTSLQEVTDKLPFAPPCRVFFKNESEQPSGSFKLRGIGNLIGKSVEESLQKYPTRKIHVFASSGGNAGLAAAYSARHYGVACTVALPFGAKPEVVDKLHEYGAETIKFGDSINEADKYLKTKMELIDETQVSKIYCHPFENRLIWDGHSTLIDEIAVSDELPKDKIKGVICSVGGGGLYNGIYQGLQRNKIDADILLIETRQAPTFVETIKKGSVFTLKSVKSLATSLACSYLSGQSLINYRNQDQIKTLVESIDDLDAVKGCLDYYDLFQNVVEPACGASLSVVFKQLPLLYKSFPDVKPDDAIVIVVCGGSCTDLDGLTEFRRMVAKFSKL